MSDIPSRLCWLQLEHRVMRNRCAHRTNATVALKCSRNDVKVDGDCRTQTHLLRVLSLSSVRDGGISRRLHLNLRPEMSHQSFAFISAGSSASTPPSCGLSLTAVSSALLGSRPCRYEFSHCEAPKTQRVTPWTNALPYPPIAELWR